MIKNRDSSLAWVFPLSAGSSPEADDELSAVSGAQELHKTTTSWHQFSNLHVEARFSHTSVLLDVFLFVFCSVRAFMARHDMTCNLRHPVKQRKRNRTRCTNCVLHVPPRNTAPVPFVALRTFEHNDALGCDLGSELFFAV